MNNLTKRFPAVLALVAGIAVLGTGCSDENNPVAPQQPDPTPAPQTIAELVTSNPNFSTLATAVNAAGLGETLQTGGPFTVFAPNNEAFAKVPEATLNALLADPEQLTNVLLYHVVPGSVNSEVVGTLLGTDVPTALEGSSIRVESSTEGLGIKVDGSNIIVVDIEAANGIVHVIDDVLIP